MTDMPGLRTADFPAYLNDVYGPTRDGKPRRPFPWQTRLLERVAESGRWPRLLDLPTGTGKTTAIDIALFHLALEAAREPRQRRAPTRIVLVVDRRTIVDQAHAQAVRIRERLMNAETPILAAVRDRLRSLSGEEAPLTVAQLRGGVLRDEAWARTPVQPVIAVSTVDQVGSRLLFRGYGITEGMRPLHAGLLGMDTLFLLDEVHLSEPFRQTLTDVLAMSQRTARPEGRDIQMVLLSATPGKQDIPEADIHRLDDDDRADDILRVRLHAEKPTTCLDIPVKGEETDRLDRVLGVLIDRVRTIQQGSPSAIGIIVNRVLTARSLFDGLAQEFGEDSTVLLTGRMRPLDRAGLERQVFRHVRAGRPPSERNIIVVATQCIEAGADFDFDHLITECASLDAIKQRFGRLNRLGSWSNSTGTIIARSDSLGGDDPVYGPALAATWEHLRTIESLNFQLDTWADPPEVNSLVSKRSDAPVLLPSHLDAWAQTRPKPRPDPEVALWLHGKDTSLPEVRVIWRAAMSNDSVLSCPPASSEALQVPLHAVRNWLRNRTAIDFADVEGEHLEDESRSKERDSDLRVAVWRERRVKPVPLREIGPEEVIIVPPERGGISNGSWDPLSKMPVSDLGDRANTEQTGRVVIRLHRGVLASYLDGIPEELPRWLLPPSAEDWDADQATDEEETSVDRWLRTVAESNEQTPPPDWLCHYAKLLLEDISRTRIQHLVIKVDDGASLSKPIRSSPMRGTSNEDPSTTNRYLIIRSPKTRRLEDLLPVGESGSAESILTLEATTDEDDGSFIGREVPLRSHLRGVGRKARDFAEKLGLTTELVTALARAGEWHDAGKADPRFQRLLSGGDEFDAFVQSEPLAKSNFAPGDWLRRQRARRHSGYPRGGRHELTSIALLQAGDLLDDLDPETTDLVLHLVATHHGYCRPLAPVVRDEDPVEVELNLEGHFMRTSSAVGLESFDSGICDRFWRMVDRFGWHQLAWLETILRLADHRQSEEEASGRNSND